MIQVSREIEDIKSEFEGGASISANFLSFLRRGANNVLDNINPETLKRRVAIFGGLGRNLFTYYIPQDVEVPSAIYSNPFDRTPAFTYVPSAEFYRVNRYNTFTIEYINGVRFAVFRHSVAPSSFTIDEMDVLGGFVSDIDPLLNQYDYISGIGAIERTFSSRTGIAFTADSTTDVITKNSHGLLSGDKIMVFNSAGALPGGLSEYTTYFVRDVTTNTFKLAATSAGAAIDLTTNGTGVNSYYLATANEISKAFSQPIDFTEKLRGIVVIPMTFPSAKDISRVEFVLEEDQDNYYTMTSLQDSVGDNFIDGLNMVRFSFASAVKTGTPDPTNITKWRLRVLTAEGTSQTIIIDKITSQKTTHFYLEYYSNRMFVDATTKAWKDTPNKNDYINLNRDAADILHYETTMLIASSSSFVKVSTADYNNFEGQLVRKYQQYWDRHPSSEMPLTYNHLHDGMPELGDYIGETIQADMEIDLTLLNLDQGTQFADNETPAGLINGVNTVYTLSHVPNPGNSLMVWINGQYMKQGVDYMLSGNIITFVTPLSALLDGTPFVAFYRYTS
jgi:hypothetical protein